MFRLFNTRVVMKAFATYTDAQSRGCERPGQLFPKSLQVRGHGGEAVRNTKRKGATLGFPEHFINRITGGKRRVVQGLQVEKMGTGGDDFVLMKPDAEIHRIFRELYRLIYAP